MKTEFQASLIIGEQMGRCEIVCELTVETSVPDGVPVCVELTAAEYKIPFNLLFMPGMKDAINDLLEQEAADKAAEIQEAEENGI